MPRKTKEPEDMLAKAKTTSSKATETKASTSKKATAKSTTKTKSSGTTKKNTSSKTKASTEVEKKASKKTSTTKKTSSKSKKTNTTKTTTKAATTKKANAVSIVEYYDLPYRYNQTVVKILAQTPNMLFVYWDISDEDRNIFKQNYGDDFFNKTKPVLIIHNETMNYSFELEINDFANSWYLNVNDANCKYVLELGRRPSPNTSNIKEHYIYVCSSNKIDAPNDHILFEKFNQNVTYKNTTNGHISQKDFSHF